MRTGIVIPAHNAADYLRDAVRSVQAQTTPDWNLIVVDDGSTDDTPDVIADITDRRIRVIRQSNAGVSAARNAGLDALPPVDAVLFLDADDWLTPDALERLTAGLTSTDATPRHRARHTAADRHASLTTTGAVLAHGAVAFIDSHDRVIGIKRPALGRDPLAAMLDRNHFANGGHLLIRREAIERAGRFRTDLRFGEDYEYWIRLALLGRFAAVPGPPVLFVRKRDAGAYLRAAHDPAAHAACVDAIFTQPALAVRLGPALPRARTRAQAEAAWIAGRALLARGDTGGLRHLTQSLQTKPTLKRAALLAALAVSATWRRRIRVLPPARSQTPPAR